MRSKSVAFVLLSAEHEQGADINLFDGARLLHDVWCGAVPPHTELDGAGELLLLLHVAGDDWVRRHRAGGQHRRVRRVRVHPGRDGDRRDVLQLDPGGAGALAAEAGRPGPAAARHQRLQQRRPEHRLQPGDAAAEPEAADGRRGARHLRRPGAEVLTKGARPAADGVQLAAQAVDDGQPGLPAQLARAALGRPARQPHRALAAPQPHRVRPDERRRPGARLAAPPAANVDEHAHVLRDAAHRPPAPPAPAEAAREDGDVRARREIPARVPGHAEARPLERAECLMRRKQK